VCAQVSDFGLSMLLRPGQEHATAAQHGALAYMPPEMIGADRLSFATDVYSYGVVLWELLTAQVHPPASQRP
jgi:serine/threonine protein kinase